MATDQGVGGSNPLAHVSKKEIGKHPYLFFCSSPVGARCHRHLAPSRARLHFVDAIEMARDAIGLSGIVNENNGIEFPKVSSCEEAVKIAKRDADEDMDFSTGILTLVDVDFVEYRRRNETRSVKKNYELSKG